MTELNALYYPYISIQETKTLKSLLAYYDRIRVIAPWSVFEERYKLSYRDLIEDGTLGVVEPWTILYRHLSDIEADIEEDLTSPGFSQLYQTEARRSWLLHEEKIMGLRVLERCARSSGHRHWVRVPFVVGEVTLINLALRAATDEHLHLVTDDVVHHRCLETSLKRRVEHSATARGRKEKARTGAAGIEAIKLLVPDLESLSFDDVVRIRRQHRPQLHRFRSAIAEIVCDLESTVWGPELQYKVQRKVQLELQPAMEKLDVGFGSELRAKLTKGIIGEISKLLGAATGGLVTGTLLATLFPIPWYGVLTTAGVGAVVGALSEAAVEHYRERNESSVAYLLSLRDAAKVAKRRAFARRPLWSVTTLLGDSRRV